MAVQAFHRTDHKMRSASGQAALTSRRMLCQGAIDACCPLPMQRAMADEHSHQGPLTDLHGAFKIVASQQGPPSLQSLLRRSLALQQQVRHSVPDSRTWTLSSSLKRAVYFHVYGPGVTACKDCDLERCETSMQMAANVSSAGVQSFMSAALHVNVRDTAGALRAISASATGAVAQVRNQGSGHAKMLTASPSSRYSWVSC